VEEGGGGSAPFGLEALVRPKRFVQGRYARVPHDPAGAEAARALRNPHMTYFETSITIRVNKVRKVPIFELEQNYKSSQCS
jgi:hypothetical protein